MSVYTREEWAAKVAADKLIFDEFGKHFNPVIPSDALEWVDNVVLRESRYIFVKRAAGVQFGYCTHCHNTFKTDSTLKQNDESECANCKSACIVKGHGVSRKYLYDSAYVIWYEKSVINPVAVVARTWRVSRDYRDDYKDIVTSFVPICMYLFEIGNPQMFEHYYWNPDTWIKRNQCISLENKSEYANNSASFGNIKSAVTDTLFQYSTWEQHDHPQFDYVKFFGLFSQYPVIELLTKMGFDYFVHAKLHNEKTFNCINWNGKSMTKVLRMTKQQIKEIREYKSNVSPFVIRLYQISRSDANKPLLADINDFFCRTGDRMGDLKVVLSYANLGRIMSYATKQQKHFKSARGTIIAWKDYILECKQLEFDLTDNQILFPKNLKQAHDRTSKMIVHHKNELTERKIAQRCEELRKYRFELNDIFFRPVETGQEIIDEGKVLSHCVGGYIDRYADGQTIILVIRRKREPEKPWFTMEIRDGKITQVYGKSHITPDPELQKVIEAFTSEKLKKTGRKSNNNQVVAV